MISAVDEIEHYATLGEARGTPEGDGSGGSVQTEGVSACLFVSTWDMGLTTIAWQKRGRGKWDDSPLFGGPDKVVAG